MSARKPAPNRNLLWAQIVVDELARAGLRAACIAPGSRSTPLTLAFAQHPDIKVYPHMDERSASFFALGIALKTDQPVALVCTSGSATANFYPAVIEAHESQVPLIILTGDRPPELRDSGANQTIDQVKLYGGYALWSVDMALPEADPDPLLIRYLRTTAARAYATANGLRKGVVHLNMPFRKPLEPTLVETDKTDFPPREDEKPFTSQSRGLIMPTNEQLDDLVQSFESHERGIIVCGPNRFDWRFRIQLSKLSDVTGYPIFADPLSGMRFGLRGISGYETFLSNMPPSELNLDADIVIRFGNVPTSKWLNDYLENLSPIRRILVSESGVWSDDLHTTTDFLQCSPLELCKQLVERLTVRENDWAYHVAVIEHEIWKAMGKAIEGGDEFDGAFIYDLIQTLPADTNLFVGNSLPIRHVDQFGDPDVAPIRVFGNRGASGIDGNVSTALGIASQLEKVPLLDGSLVLLVGDITFYHDMNGLFAVKNLDLKNVTIVLMNNNGGGIFNRLPISGYDPAFTDLFIMPHGLQFEHAARLYGLDFVSTDNREEFRQVLGESIGSGVPRIIEVRTDYKHDEIRRKEVIQAVKNAIHAKIQGKDSK